MDNLIIVRTHGGRPTMTSWWVDGDPHRNWDLYISPYKEAPIADIPPLNTMPGYLTPEIGVAKTLVGDVFSGMKMISLNQLLNTWQGWREYKYIMLTDDDLFAMPGTLSKFFSLCHHYNAKVATPALTEDSFFSYVSVVRNTEFVARRVTFVETQTPAIRVDVLSEFLPEFAKATEMGGGWGLDYLLATRCGHRDMFVIDETPVTHCRPSSVSKERGDAGCAELVRISGYQFDDWVQKTIAGIDSDGREIPETDKEFLPRLMKGGNRLFTRDPNQSKVLMWHQQKKWPYPDPYRSIKE